MSFSCYHLQSPPPSLRSHTSPFFSPPQSHSFPTIKCSSRWFWVQQQQQSMVGALLECTHTHHGQHLFMNGPTIAHPPTATADRGRGAPQVTKSKRRDKAEQGSQNRGRERQEIGDIKVSIANWLFYGLFYPILVPDGYWGEKTQQKSKL